MSNAQDLNAIATQLIAIRALQDALKEEESALRSLLSVGDKITLACGEVALSERTTTTYKEDLYDDLLTLGVDPLTLGRVKITPDAKKVASAEAINPQVRVALDKSAVTKTTPVLRVKVDAQEVVEGRKKCASLLGG